MRRCRCTTASGRACRTQSMLVLAEVGSNAQQLPQARRPRQLTVGKGSVPHACAWCRVRRELVMQRVRLLSTWSASPTEWCFAYVHNTLVPFTCSTLTELLNPPGTMLWLVHNVTAPHTRCGIGSSMFGILSGDWLAWQRGPHSPPPCLAIVQSVQLMRKCP